jgi:hypothetical protein
MIKYFWQAMVPMASLDVRMKFYFLREVNAGLGGAEKKIMRASL